MALTVASAHLCVVFVLACIAVAAGTRLLRRLGLSADGALEEAVYAAGLFFAVLQVMLLLLAEFGWLRRGVVIPMLCAVAVSAGTGWLQIGRVGAEFVRSLQRARKSILWMGIIALTTVCVLVDAFMAMAPLTGSDAMFYHFTAPMLEVGKTWQPIFWLSQSFYAGGGHALIQLGMTLGSDHISMGLIYLGGLLTAMSLFVIVRNLVGELWAWLAALIFFTTPMVFWQISTSGCPDIWIAFYTLLAVLAASRSGTQPDWKWLLLAGLFAGAAAGVKYTSWIIPASVALWCGLATRSFRRGAICAASSLPAGVLPLIRNAWWSGDPFFPFLTRWLTPSHFNAFSFNAILADLHSADSSRTLSGLLSYPLLFPLKGDAYGGFGRYWGPLVLAFVPLAVLVVRKNLISTATATVWAAILLANALTAQQPRYLLPVFPLAVALIISGVAHAIRRRWRAAQIAAVCSLCLFVAFGATSEVLYARNFIPVAVGLEPREVFLERMAPDYAKVAFINRSLAGQDGKVMVFFRYLYYLQVPFETGDPRVSWLVNPEKLSTQRELSQFLRQENIRWVVKAPDYPESLAQAFQGLEKQGYLRPISTADVSTSAGFRMYGEKVSIRVTLLQVCFGNLTRPCNS